MKAGQAPSPKCLARSNSDVEGQETGSLCRSEESISSSTPRDEPGQCMPVDALKGSYKGNSNLSDLGESFEPDGISK